MRIEDPAVFYANRTTETGAGIGVLGWLASDNWIGWAGVLIALVGLLANLYYQRRRDGRDLEFKRRQEAREQELHDVQMAAYRERGEL